MKDVRRWLQRDWNAFWVAYFVYLAYSLAKVLP